MEMQRNTTNKMRENMQIVHSLTIMQILVSFSLITLDSGRPKRICSIIYMPDMFFVSLIVNSCNNSCNL